MARQAVAVRRLMQDLKELEQEPVVGVRVRSHESNIFKLLVYLQPQEGKFHGHEFRMGLTFTEEYPDQPPSLVLFDHWQLRGHPNVFGEYVCLNMLRTEQEAYSGWSCAYSLTSIAMQLQTFLFAENVPQDQGTDRRNLAFHSAPPQAPSWGKQWVLEDPAAAWHTIESRHNPGQFYWFNSRTRRSQCNAPAEVAWLGTSPASVWTYVQSRKHPGSFYWRNTKTSEAQWDHPSGTIKPPPPPPRASAASPESQSRPDLSLEPWEGIGLMELPEEVIARICDWLTDMRDLAALIRTSHAMRHVAANQGLWVRRQLRCFYHRTGFTDDVLGCGLSVARKGARGRDEDSMQLHLDLLSKAAFFQQGVRRGPFDAAPFQEWLPVLLGPEHGRRAVPYLRAALARLACGLRPPALAPSHSPDEGALHGAELFEPLQALEVLPCLMNSMVVAFMRHTLAEEAGKRSGSTGKRASEQALRAYCACHHMLLRLAAEHPEVTEHANEAVTQFCRHECHRSKPVTPSLGKFLVLLTVCTSHTWPDVAPLFLRETLIRSAKWYLCQDPQSQRRRRRCRCAVLAVLDEDTKLEAYFRLKKTFRVTGISRRLVMFQVSFLRMAGRPDGCTAADMLQRYDSNHGHCAPGLAARLLEAVKAMQAVTTWPGYLEHIGVPPAAPPEPGRPPLPPTPPPCGAPSHDAHQVTPPPSLATAAVADLPVDQEGQSDVPPDPAVSPAEIAVCEMLQESIRASLRKGYHTSDQVLRSARCATWAELVAYRKKLDRRFTQERTSAEGPFASAHVQPTLSTHLRWINGTGDDHPRGLSGGEGGTPSCTICVRNLPSGSGGVDSIQLWEAYMPFGSVMGAKVAHTDARGGASRQAVGYVTFGDAECAKAAQEHAPRVHTHGQGTLAAAGQELQVEFTDACVVEVTTGSGAGEREDDGIQPEGPAGPGAVGASPPPSDAWAAAGRTRAGNRGAARTARVPLEDVVSRLSPYDAQERFGLKLESGLLAP